MGLNIWPEQPPEQETTEQPSSDLSWLLYPGALLAGQPQTFGDSGSNALSAGENANRYAAARDKILNKIASGEATRYNELYGGGSFNSYADHPGIEMIGPNGKPTSAAGMFMFEKGTWEREKNLLGLTDFSPVNQRAGAFDLAQRTYKQKTGRDIVDDELAGKVDWSALSGQWPSLAKVRGGSEDSAGNEAATMDNSDGETDTAASSPVTSSTAGADSADARMQRGMMALALMQMLAPKHQFTPVDYDPFKVMPRQNAEGEIAT